MEQTVDPDLKEVLRKTLDDLDERAFKSFKRDLRDQKKIPWSQLETADRDDTVDLMVQVYTSEAGDVMLSILLKIGQNQLAHDLNRNLISDQESQHLAIGEG
ncbi:caspase b-like [Engraulis encrasicolus]|uniref:caspase b-like n=1 Tax=Engraulis encrasicolus TaxID=184585 RepID=UPI002FCE6A89